MACDGGAPGWIFFLPFVVGVSSAAERILYLQGIPGELSRSDLSWVVARSPFVGVRLDLLVWGLFLGVLVGTVFTGLGVELWSSGMVVEGGVWGRSNGADGCGHVSRISCSLPMLESALWFGTAVKGGVKSRCLARCSAKLGCRQDLGKRKSSGQDLDVISMFLKDLFACKKKMVWQT
ncbi:hypothetical protein PVAP13_8KG280101 [Panicum virgatum]|uniref:Uncharacterized protein n=1 Tax=Panicum virgatum TaxID=38727 RepID=A0A8T0PJM4_PANVG|nr:hypothetical protein PVAP13_8KG280101 [Panicum virgatum]